MNGFELKILGEQKPINGRFQEGGGGLRRATVLVACINCESPLTKPPPPSKDNDRAKVYTFFNVSLS